MCFRYVWIELKEYYMFKLSIIILAGFMFFNMKAQDKAVISIDEMNKKAKNDNQFIILDVRTPQELNGPLGQIEGVINIPLQELNRRIDELEPYEDKEIAVICRSGNRSHYATETLRKNGYNAKNVLGGMIEYRKK
jgi:rhodanese-related sulfurtransferase